MPDLSTSFPTLSGGRLNVYNSLMLAAAYYDCSVGVEEIFGNTNDVLVYPNPATDILNVALKNFGGKNSHMEIRNLLGQNLLQEEIASGSTTISLDVSGYESGIYFLTIQNEQTSYLIRFVKE